MIVLISCQVSSQIVKQSFLSTDPNKNHAKENKAFMLIFYKNYFDWKLFKKAYCTMF